MNRHQRRASKHRNPYAAVQAQMETDLRRVLAKAGIHMVAFATAQGEGGATRWIVTVRKEAQELVLHLVPKSILHTVQDIVGAFAGQVPAAPASEVPAAVTSEVPASINPMPGPITSNSKTEDLEEYLR